MEKLEKQELNKPQRDAKGRLLPGNTANPNGRPKGKTLKEWVREQLQNMPEEERIEFLKTIPKLDQWKMAEGVPDSKTESTGVTKVLLIDQEQAEIYGIRTTPESEDSGEEQSKV